MNSELMLKELRYLRGRKISKVREDYAQVCLHFEDGTFCVLSGGKSYGCEYLELETDLGSFSPRDLSGLDIITKEECQAREDEQELRWSKENLANRRKHYEALKAEFEPE